MIQVLPGLCSLAPCPSFTWDVTEQGTRVCLSSCPASPGSSPAPGLELTHLKEKEKYKTKTILSSDLYHKKKRRREKEDIQDQYIQTGELHLITVVYIHWTKFTSFYINLYV